MGIRLYNIQHCIFVYRFLPLSKNDVEHCIRLMFCLLAYFSILFFVWVKYLHTYGIRGRDEYKAFHFWHVYVTKRWYFAIDKAGVCLHRVVGLFSFIFIYNQNTLTTHSLSYMDCDVFLSMVKASYTHYTYSANDTWYEHILFYSLY